MARASCRAPAGPPCSSAWLRLGGAPHGLRRHGVEATRCCGRWPGRQAALPGAREPGLDARTPVAAVSPSIHARRAWAMQRRCVVAGGGSGGWSGHRMAVERAQLFHFENFSAVRASARVLPSSAAGARVQDAGYPISHPATTETATCRFNFTVNGRAVTVDAPPNTLLVQAIREHLHLTGTHVGCDTAQCGACTVHRQRPAIKSCNVLAGAGGRRRDHHHRRHRRRPTAPCTRCRPPSRNATACNAASARPAW